MAQIFLAAVTATEAEGYRYGSNNELGITVFDIHPPVTTSKDEIAFGFMTWGENGTLLRVDGDPSSGHFIDAQLVSVSQFMFQGSAKSGPRAKSLSDP